MMLGPEGQKALKTLHLLAVFCWVGASFSLLILWLFGPAPQSGEELFGMRKVHNFIAFVVTANVGAYGTLFTGVAYSLCTNLVFFWHKWIILKWAITLAVILMGYIAFAPLNTQLLEHVIASGSAIPDSTVYKDLTEQYKRLALVSMTLFIIATVLSVYKPWEKRELEKTSRMESKKGPTLF